MNENRLKVIEGNKVMSGSGMMRKIVFGTLIGLLIVAGTARAQDAGYYYDRGLESRMIQKKIDYFTQALELDPNLFAAYEKRGTLLYFQEKYARAIQDFEKIARLKPFESNASKMLGRSFMKTGDLDEAAAHLTRAIQLDSTDAEAYGYRAEVYRLKSMLEKARQDATRAIELGVSGPIAGRAYTVRFKVYRALGNSEQADADFKKAARLDPEHYKYNMLTSTELLADWAGQASRISSVSWMGVALIAALVFVVIFRLALPAPEKENAPKDKDH